MYEVDVQGTYYEMGFKVGRRLKEVGYVPPPPAPARWSYILACEAIISQHAPELLEELQGCIDGSGYNADAMKALVIGLDDEPACSIVALGGPWTPDGNILFGRNYDGSSSFTEFNTVYRTAPHNALASFGCSNIFIGRLDGLNEAGLAVAVASVGHDDEQPGIMCHLVVRSILDRCREVADAVEFLERIPHTWNCNYLIADASRNIAIVEASPQQVLKRYITDGFATITNHFQSPVMAHYERIEERPPDSEDRLCKIQQWLERQNNPVGHSELQKMLRDRKNGAYTYRWYNNMSEPMVTLWSWTAILGERQVQLDMGLRSHKGFVTYEF